MQTRTARRLGAGVLAATVAVSLLGGAAASAKPATRTRAAHTKMRFKLDDRRVTQGDTVTGLVTLRSGRGRRDGAPLAGADLTVLVDHVEVATVTTDADGKAVVSYLSNAAGDHVIRVVFAGTAEQRGAHRSQGFSVKAPDPVV